MKIVCDACQAKYSISDDKVQGKVFKIRCKKCSNIIVVRGGAGAAEPAPAPQQEKDTRVYDYGYEGGERAPTGDDAVWHVVINQDQVGPMTAVDVQRRFTSGEIDAETYIWREGFADWLPLTKVESFASLLASGNGAASAPRVTGNEAVAAMFGGGEDAGAARSDTGDLFGAPATSAGRDEDGDLFGGKPAAAQAGQSAKMRGERNENSVLFSLNNLAQLASDKPAPAARGAMTASPAAGAATGSSGGEGSGLIDIRSMANAYMGGPGNSPKPVTAGVGSIDDLPVFGGGSFTEPAVIVPIAKGPSSNKLLYALVGSVGLLVLAGVIVVIVMLRGGSGGNAGSAATASPPPVTTRPDQVAAAEPKPDTAKPPAPAEPPAETKPAAVATAAETKPAASEPPADHKDPGKVATTDTASAEPKRPAAATPHHTAGSSSTSSSPPKSTAKAEKPSPVTAAAPKEAPPPKADSKADGGGCDEVSCVLNSYEGACCAKFRKGKAPAAAAGGGGGGGGAGKGDLPDSLDRAMISDGVAKMKARVMACGDKSPAKGQVKVSVKVAADGSVANVTVRNTPDPGLGNCVAGVMQQARFAKTQTGGSFAYPFQF